MSNWMIYGAYGFTGRLIVEEAVRRGMRPLLAGRDAERTASLAEHHGLDHVVFGLDADPAPHLAEVDVMVNCAGPFGSTAQSVIEACIATGTHYVDITGEIGVFELAASLGERAADAGVLLCPGFGFDVVPTDCVAAVLAEALPDATHLALGFDTQAAFSSGTTLTGALGLADGDAARIDGKIVYERPASHDRMIDFGNGEKLAMSFDWGDVSTAFHSTGIPNIRVFVPTTPELLTRLRRSSWVRPLLRLPFLKAAAVRKAKAVVDPTHEAMEATPSWIWGEATNAAGTTKVARVTVPNGYLFTATAIVESTRRILEGTGESGFKTPSLLFGARYVEELEGAGTIEITEA